MSLRAGVGVRDVSPTKPMFLVGYPHVPRTSTGIHDPLLASALCLENATTRMVLVAVDVLFLMPETVRLCRQAIAARAGVPAENILIAPTHTHSGPVTGTMLAWGYDPVVPAPDPEYMDRLVTGIVDAAVAAATATEPAAVAVTAARAEGVGGNRLDPHGPFDPTVGLIAVRRERDQQLVALDLVYGMHPTVLHEDSTLVSSDFPHYTRVRLRERFPELTTVYHMGPSGNASTRHHVRGQTFAEAERLGRKLGDTAVAALERLGPADFRPDFPLRVATVPVELPPNQFPAPATARQTLQAARARYDQLRATGAPRAEVRTAECAVFGAEALVVLAEAQATGEVARQQAARNPAEVQVLRIGDAYLVGWPCEIFGEFGLELKQAVAPLTTFIITPANGELQGYIVMPTAAAAGGYEAAFAMFHHESGTRLVAAAARLIRTL